MTLLLYYLVLAPITVGLTQYIFNRPFFKYMGLLFQFSFIVIAIYFFSIPNQLFPLVGTPLPTGMILKVDATSNLFLFLSSVLFFSLTLFSNQKKYMNKLFLFLFMSLQGLINGVFLSYDLFNAYVLIEVATITVSILIMYKKDKQSMYDGMIYLTINMIAMAFFLFGIAVLYKTTGVLDFGSLRSAIQNIEDTKRLNLSFALLFTGVSIKAAVLPLFSWLPKAHGTASAPSIVSAVLSGVFVKIGIYLLIRIQWMYMPMIDIQPLVLAIGYLTAIAGFIFAISHSDIKLILAYHTVSQIGLILIGIGGSMEIHHFGALYHVLSHGIFKSLLFIIAGVLIYRYGTRKITDMKGLWQLSKPLSILLVIAVFSITGAPFFSGGFSKYLIGYRLDDPLQKGLLMLINWGTMISFIKFFYVIIKPLEHSVDFFSVRKSEFTGMWLLAAFCIGLGTFGPLVLDHIFHVQLDYSFVDQLTKLPAYLINYLGCYLVYVYIIKDNFLLKYIRRLELSFNSINLAIVTFFIFSLVYLNQ
ncbi:MAG: hypothetical protein BGO41_08250 [Clostridiales bacterium 38-18]|nr:MAG: hypothetical protein BGO41_08250 [Clostridiales bacterium 38-18]